ncbi:hypothetical protein KAR48_06130 [bacterium]|nr:hypothetical protein [bacterium]
MFVSRIRQIFIILTAILILTIQQGCDKGKQSTILKSTDGTVYFTTIYDLNLLVKATGTFSIHPEDGYNVSGQWSFQPADAMENINNPFTGQGNMEGQLQNDSLWVNLHPGWADNNVWLRGTVHGDSLNGTWMWSGFPGIIDNGTFKAVIQ